jgi:hypothetical protein
MKLEELMTYEDFQKIKWLSVYGAYIAIQSHQQLIDGKGGVLPEDMERYKEEAKAVADLALEGEGE